LGEKDEKNSENRVRRKGWGVWSPSTGRIQMSPASFAFHSIIDSIFPSGDQDSGPCPFSLVVSLTSAPLPSAAFQQMLVCASRAEEYATRFPSGDHTGPMLCPSTVNRRNVPRSKS